ncbi:MAG TPA: alpha/beta hydrolase [Ferruginibacter sp.]|nr:alpha/beta hydrolase [Ferruginibacter sp.]
MKVYFISGLAADSRVFNNIKLPGGYEPIYLDWITPQEKETLKSYALRLSGKIDPTQHFVLVGLSMGGMIAIEIAKLYPPVTTIIVSSIPNSDQFPPHFRLAGYLGLHTLIPARLFKSLSIINRYFNPDTREDKIILKQIIKDSDPRFIKWAIGAILSWRNHIIPQPLLQIHGSADRLLPARYTNPTHLISNGGHLMIMNKANELNKILEEALISLN